MSLDKMIPWEKSIEQDDRFLSAFILISEAAKDAANLIIQTESRQIRETHSDPRKSIFQARRCANLVIVGIHRM